MTPHLGFRRTLVATLVLAFCTGLAVYAQWTPLPVTDDPLVRMPGTQPGQVTSIEAPGRCTNCHGDYGGGDAEPASGWPGSMMAQGARDFVFWACMTVGAQDSIWVLGRPNATDICERCHFPQGWMEGRSDPTNASLMTASDYDSLHCDVCHSMVDPHFESTYNGSHEGSDWLNYWDETDASGTPSSSAAADTYAEDVDQLTSVAAITLYNGNPFYAGNLPPDPNYTEAASGQMFLAATRDKRASFADANGRHGMWYSRFHKSKYFCATCHDVSNPALANLAHNGLLPGDGTTVLPSEQLAAGLYHHVERTFSEFLLSDYGLQGGSPGIGPYAPGLWDTSDPNDWIRNCQDCHMRDIQGQKAATQNDAVIRASGSTEHPNSGVPMHDLAGGNAWVMYVLASSVPGSPNHDATNDALLNQGPATLTLNMTQGIGLMPDRMLAGVQRAKDNLIRAASILDSSYDQGSGLLTFKVRNNTAHKLISGFPEGRRMFVNVKAYQSASLIWEVNPYDYTVGTLKGLGVGSSPPLGPNEEYVDELVYEAKTTSALTGEQKTFHFVLATGRYKDNRIPPKGFRIAEAANRHSQPVWHGVDDLTWFTSAEYAGGFDDVSITIPAAADQVEIALYYQTTSREYIEFLRDEINGTATTLSSPTPAGLPDAYIAQSDPWFSQMAAWGNTIWQLWDHNKNVDGAAPYQMTSASATIISGPVAAGQIPDGYSVPGTPLDISVGALGDITLTWDVSCLPGDSDYAIYEGTMGGSFNTHAPLFCSTGGATTYTFAPSAGATYYLVVPMTASREGSHGQTSTGTERSTSAAVCLPQQFGGC